MNTESILEACAHAGYEACRAVQRARELDVEVTDWDSLPPELYKKAIEQAKRVLLETFQPAAGIESMVFFSAARSVAVALGYEFQDFASVTTGPNKFISVERLPARKKEPA